MVKRFAFLMLLLVAGVPASATQPECTGDRHYDGVGCCPYPEESTTTTTSTTLPGEECPSCPLPPPCQPVHCEDGDDGAPGQVVIVDRCPEFPQVMYRPCREYTGKKSRYSNGQCRKGLTAFAGRCWKCPRPGTPKRGLLPFVVGTY